MPIWNGGEWVGGVGDPVHEGVDDSDRISFYDSFGISVRLSLHRLMFQLIFDRD